MVDAVVDGWQIECCHLAPAVDDVVTWPLAWLADQGGPGVVYVAWVATPLRLGPAPHQVGLVLRCGALTAWWSGSDPAAVPARGRLSVEVHAGVPDQLPRTSGRVQQVQVIDQALFRGPSGVWERVPSDYRLRPVRVSPRSFAGGPLAAQDGGPRTRWEVGVLVGLELPSTPASGGDG